MTLATAPPRGSDATVGALRGDLADGARDDLAVLAFYCAGRRHHLGPDAEREVGSLAVALGRDVAGAVSLGEIGGLRDLPYPHFHNGALVCAALGPA
jgi:hypothetical protein